MIKIGIVGSRRRDSHEDSTLVLKALQKLMGLDNFITLVSGGCPKGADRFAEWFASHYNLPIIIHYPDKSKLDKILSITNPTQAYAQINFARNKLIAFDSDYLIACVAEDRTGGTENTIKHFKELGKEKNLILV